MFPIILTGVLTYFFFTLDAPSGVFFWVLSSNVIDFRLTPAFKYNKNSQDQKLQCKHIVCVLIIIGVKDELNYHLTDQENAIIEIKVQNFCEQNNEENIRHVLGTKGKQLEKNPIPQKPANSYEKFKTKD